MASRGQVQTIPNAAIEFARAQGWQVSCVSDLKTGTTVIRFVTKDGRALGVGVKHATTIDDLMAWLDTEGVSYSDFASVQNFANHPKSIGELRADRSQMASDWTPRDALIDMLRGIDSGEITLDALVIVGRRTHEDGSIKVERRVCSPDAIVAVGLLNRAAFEIQHSNAHDD